MLDSTSLRLGEDDTSRIERNLRWVEGMVYREADLVCLPCMAGIANALWDERDWSVRASI